jgi:hypothetical protein
MVQGAPTQRARTPAPSVVSAMEGLREPTGSVDGPALAASMEEAFTEEAFTEEALMAVAGGSSYRFTGRLTINVERMTMKHRIPGNQAGRALAAVFAAAIVAAWAIYHPYLCLAQQSGQQTFPSAEEASRSLFQAVQLTNGPAIAEILGGPTDLASSGDEDGDKLDRELFLRKYQEMHRLAREADGSVTLYIGAENWPFPVPLIATNGAWRFDSEAGLEELLFRRIGENELTAIEVCHELVAARTQRRTKSNTADREENPPTNVISRDSESAVGAEPVWIHGYYFRALTTDPKSGHGQATAGKANGASGFVAYPAEYRSSGVMTFIVSENGVVYEKDLGPNASTSAAGTGAFHKDATWRAVDESPWLSKSASVR